jgi:outer membrane receptor protein involved in Fe transport
MSTHRALRRAVCSVLTLSALHASIGHAADDAPEADIIVTGSRIARPEFEASVPVQVITAKTIEETGKQNVADILSEMPAVGTATFSRASSNFLTSGNGVSTVNLRNMGDKRTLVLVNGRRAVSGIGGSSSVDLNDIPTDLISNVEVITGGASAVYGSEAIAGVVNFTLKDNFEGLEFRGQGGQTGESDNTRTLSSLTAGMNFLDRGNVTFNFQYDKDNGLRSSARARSADDVPARSSFSPQGLFFGTGANKYTFDNSNTLIAGQPAALQFNRNALRYISVPVERKLYTTLAHYDFNDKVTAFFEGSYSDVLSNSSLEPLAVTNADGIGPDGNPSPGLSVADNPFIPAVIRNDLAAGGEDSLLFRKRLNGVFDRSNFDHRFFYRVVGGLRGTVFNDWHWDVYANQGETVDHTRSQTALRDRFFFAMDAVDGPNGTVICRDATARANGCAPFNPFGFNSVSDASAAYITNNHHAFATYDADIKEQVAAANLTGELFQMPAGAVKVATGLEYRKEQSSEIYDADTQAGNTMSNALSNTIGEYHVSEAYLETIVPLLKDAPGAHSLDAEAAVRVGDYSTVGGVTSWKLGLTWAPINDVRLRGVYSSATRAPNIGELFAGANQNFPTGLTDPCEGITATTAGALANYCRSLPGVNAAIAANPNHKYEYALSDSQTIQGFDLSNRNLKQETAKTITAGVVFTPEALHNFTASVDWFSIDIKHAINQLPRQVIIDDCTNSLGVSPLCQFLTREPVNSARGRTAGTVYNIDSPFVNSGGIRTEGIDTQVRYGLDLGARQHLQATLTYTYLNKLELKANDELPFDDEVGQLNSAGRLGAGFRHRATAMLNYSVGGLDVVWTSRFLSSTEDTKVDPSLDPALNRIGSYVYHDVQMRYSFPWLQRVEAYAGVDNVFDKQPPVIGQDGASNVTGTETAADTYDAIGRFIYAGVQVKF